MKLPPEFERPPVVEVAVSVQFNAPVLDGPLLMLRWTQVRDRFPKYAQAPPLPPSHETFDGPQEPRVEFQIGNTPPAPRLLMISESQTGVLQIQQDRFGYSWRKLGPEHEYPRYRKIRDEFQRELAAFNVFLSEEKQAALSPVQCEVTYVNVILPEGVWNSHSDLAKIVPSAAQLASTGSNPYCQVLHERERNATLESEAELWEVGHPWSRRSMASG